MIPKECKRLAEVDFPIAQVSKHSAGEKSRGGHPSSLHLWWARRPLAACRSILLALLWPDPCDPNCPKEFKAAARRLLPRVQGEIGLRDIDLRHELLKFIGNFANWDLSADANYLEVSRALVKAVYGENPPLVVDPFAGGGSIPLEALRVGCDSFAGDLNPVACLILKTMLEDMPRYGPQLADEVQRAGTEISRQAERDLRAFYPQDPGGARPVAYLWARTVLCESPNCGAEIPLVRSFWLCRKASRKRALKYNVVRRRNEAPKIIFEIFEPRNEREVPGSTITRAKATCIACGSVLTAQRVRAQLIGQHGGADSTFDKTGRRIGGACLLAVVTVRPGEQGRSYRLPDERDWSSILAASRQLSKFQDELRKGVKELPDESISLNEIRRISVPLYGATSWGDIFTSRQKLTLATYARLIRDAKLSEACSRLCALALDRLLIVMSAHCRWKPTGESLIDMFGRHAIGMVWDFAESNPGTGDHNIFRSWINRYGALLGRFGQIGLHPGQVAQSDASQHYLPEESCQVWFTDPPYYDSIPYAHLSDCFYVWIKRIFGKAGTPSFEHFLTPKDGECVVDRPHRLSTSNKDERYFEGKIAEAAVVGRSVLAPDGCACIVFAHKTTEGWEALLSGIIGARWCITASWPIATELESRLNARDTASLATSVHLVCRPRPDNAPTGDWSEVLRELPKRVGDWMERLQSEGVRGADLVFACIGPALEIFSRYSRVETAEGREVKLAEYLEKVWEVVGRTALEQVLGTAEARARNGAAGALEEDARLTALFLWTLQSTNVAATQSDAGAADDEDISEEDDEDETASRGSSKGFSLVFDVVRRFAQPLGIGLPKWDGRIIETKKGVVRLLPVTERSRQLFGEDGTQIIAERLEKSRGKETLQLKLFGAAPDGDIPERQRRARRGVPISDSLGDHPDATTLDRVHMAMLLQANGRTNALRMLLKAEQERGPDFLRLANALSALYPRTSEEKRLLDAMLLAVPR